MADPTLYLFDGYNLLHAGAFDDVRALRDELASFVALRGARGVLVFDGVGPDELHGRLEVRWTPDADTLLERLAAEHRDREQVCLVSSDSTVQAASGQEVAKVGARSFLTDMDAGGHSERTPSSVADRVDDETRKRLENLRRGRFHP